MNDYDESNYLYDHPESDEIDFDARENEEQERADLANDDRRSFDG